MSLGSILKSIGNWFAKAFNSIKDDADTVAITLTQYLKVALDSGLLKTIADLIPGGLGKDVITVLQNAIPKILALELGLQGLPDNATPEQIQAFILSIEQAVGGKDFQAKSAFWTKFSVQVYSLIQTEINKSPDHATLTFAQIVSIVEEAYQQYMADQEAVDPNLPGQ